LFGVTSHSEERTSHLPHRLRSFTRATPITPVVLRNPAILPWCRRQLRHEAVSKGACRPEKQRDGYTECPRNNAYLSTSPLSTNAPNAKILRSYRRISCSRRRNHAVSFASTLRAPP